MDRTLFSRKRQGLGYANEDLPVAPETKMKLFRRQAKELFDDNYTDLRTKDGTFDCEVLDDNGKPTDIRYCWYYYIDTDKHPLPELEKAMEMHRASDHYQKDIIGFTGKSPLFKRFEDARFFLDMYDSNVKFYNEVLADDKECRLYLKYEKKLEWAHILSTKDGGEEEVFESFRKDLKKINNAFLLRKAIRGLEIAQKEVADNKQYYNNVAHKIEIAKDVLAHCNWAQDQAEKYHKFINEPATAKKLTPFDCVSTNKQRPVFCGCLHENGTIVGTDSHIIWAHNTTYDKRYEGKIVLPPKSKVEISAGAKFPNWKSVIPQIDNWNTVRVDFAKLYNIASKACTYQKELDDNKNNLFVKLDKLDVLMNFQSDLFCKFCRASITMGCDTLYYSNDLEKAIVATNENGVVVLMPRFSNKLTYEDKLAIPVAFPEDYAIDSNAPDNDRERRLRLAKARAKAMIMLQEQRNRETKATLNGLDARHSALGTRHSALTKATLNGLDARHSALGTRHSALTKATLNGLDGIDEDFADKLNEFILNGYKFSDRREYFSCGYPQKVLQLCDLDADTEIVITQDGMRKILGQKKGKQDNAHDLTPIEILRLPQLLREPILVINGNTSDSRLVFIEIPRASRKVFAVISVDKFLRLKNERIYNLVASVYSQNDNKICTKIEQSIATNNVWYYDSRKIKNWLSVVGGLQLSSSLKANSLFNEKNAEHDANINK